MARADRNGNRRLRSSVQGRHYSLGYYCIFTDTTETEENYLIGLKNALPKELQKRISIKICKSKTKKLVERCKEQVGLMPVFAEPWIVFDRDRVPNFDSIIAEAEEYGFKVGWSNPCIEVWFGFYFGRPLTQTDSVSLCRAFANLYNKQVGREYKKSDKALYSALFQHGDEVKAIQLAERTLERLKKAGYANPSSMYPCTTLHHLVKQIRDRAKDITA